ncbi:hypothetical protein GEMRC1_012194 [Eukaryota sp. GEM-RC1]
MSFDERCLVWQVVKAGQDRKMKRIAFSDCTCLIRGRWHGGSDVNKLPSELRHQDLLFSIVSCSRTLDLCGFSANDVDLFCKCISDCIGLPVIEKRLMQ